MVKVRLGYPLVYSNPHTTCTPSPRHTFVRFFLSYQTIRLVKLRLEHRWQRAGSSSKASKSQAELGTALATASVHTCPYDGMAALHVRVYSPGEAWCDRGNWQFHLLNVAELNPHM